MAILALDAGTTGVRAIVFDDGGRVVAHAARELRQFFPRPGWVEQDPDEIWRLASTVAREAVEFADRPIAAVGVTNQRETVVIWDRRTGRPVRRAIVWQDRRTAARCAELAPVLDLIRRATGLVLDPYFSATKLEWLLRDLGDEIDRRHLACGTVDSYLIWRMTGGRRHVTDPSNASRTMLYDIGRGDWSDELLEEFGVPAHMMPEIVPSSGLIDHTDVAGALARPVPLAGILGDQQAALLGQACLVPGMAKNTYGTGSFLLMNIGTACPEPTNGLLTTVAWQLPGQPLVYALEGAMFTTGAAIQWLRDALGIIASAAEIGPLAESVPDSGGVVVVPAFAGLGSPWWDPTARGAIVGLTRGTTKAHLARAVVESIAFQTRDVVAAMAAAGGRGLDELRVDGGAAQLDLLLRLQADQLHAPVVRSATGESTALGAAFAAGIGVGEWSVDEVSQCWRADARFEPRERPETEPDYARWLRALPRAQCWDQ